MGGSGWGWGWLSGGVTACVDLLVVLSVLFPSFSFPYHKKVSGVLKPLPAENSNDESRNGFGAPGAGGLVPNVALIVCV